MIVDENNNRHIIADEGKSLYRKSDGSGPYKEILLGMHKYGFIIRNETVMDFEEREDTNNE